MTRLRTALLAGAFLCAGHAFAGQEVTLTDGQGHLDRSNMPYSLWPTLTAGTTYTGLRGIAAHCTAAGATTLTDASSNAMVWDVAVGFQQQPFIVSTFTAVSGCTFYGLN